MSDSRPTKSTTISFYYDPASNVWCRKTKSNDRRDAHPSDFEWKEFSDLYPRHQQKLSALTIAEQRTIIKGLGSWRKSAPHSSKNYSVFYLHNESWLKEPPCTNTSDTGSSASFASGPDNTATTTQP